MRSLPIVLDQLVLLEPSLEEAFKSLRQSIAFSAPELMSERWNQAAYILGEHIPPEHPKFNDIAHLWMGRDSIPTEAPSDNPKDVRQNVDDDRLDSVRP